MCPINFKWIKTKLHFMETKWILYFFLYIKHLYRLIWGTMRIIEFSKNFQNRIDPCAQRQKLAWSQSNVLVSNERVNSQASIVQNVYANIFPRDYSLF